MMMMQIGRRARWLVVAWVMVWMVVAIGYLVMGRPFLYRVGLDGGDHWLVRGVAIFYVRLPAMVGSQSADFLLRMGDQLAVRWSLLWLGVVLLVAGRFGSGKGYMVGWCDLAVSGLHVGVLCALFYWSVLAFTRLSYWELEALRPLEVLAVRHGFYVWLPWVVPPSGLLLVLELVKWGAGLSLMVWPRPVVALVFALVFVYLEGIFFCFSGVSHHYATFGYAAMLMPLLLVEYVKAGRGGVVHGWALQLIRLAVVLPYSLAGFEKLMFSGLTWVLPAELGIDGLGLFFWVGPVVVLLQLGSVVVVFYRRLLYVFIPLGIAFHVGNAVLLGVGAVLHPWWVAYLFLVDWDWVLGRIGVGWSGVVAK